MTRTTQRTPRLTYVIGTYPVPTTTFIDREIAAVRRLGVDVRVISIRRPDVSRLSDPQRRSLGDVSYVLPARFGDLLRSHLAFLRSRPGALVGSYLRLVSRPHPTARSRVRTLLHVGLGVHVAWMLRERSAVDHLHAHFVDRAAVVALVAGRLLDRSFSATAHANDIYVEPVLLPEKISSAKFIATCTSYNDRHLRSVANGAGGNVRCIYHGLDLDRFEPGTASRTGPPLVLSVGQLKEKKGFGDLLQACRLLADRGVDFRCEIVGDGPLGPGLRSRIVDLGLDTRVRLTGALPLEDVMERYRAATVFALPCVTGTDGDRDGIPNVILEAMAMGLPVVSTRHSGIPEAVQDGWTGVLVSPADPRALADAIAGLLADPERRDRFGRRGRERVQEVFDAETNAKALLAAVVA